MLTPAKRTILLLTLFLSTSGLLFAFGSREVPQIQVQNPSPWYLSPTGKSATAKHTASVTFAVKMPMKSKTGYIPDYSIAIENSSGTIVKTIARKQKPDLGFFARLFTARKSFTIKKKISWNGMDNSGNVVPDGRYTAKLTVTAQDGTKQNTTLGTFIVDTQPPNVTISAPDGLVFNPTGNGKHVTLPIKQVDGTVQSLWTGTFYNSQGKAVRTYTWNNSAPQSFAWGGRNNAGKLLPDGHYVYKITSTDKAGNKSPNEQISDIVINTEKTPIAIALSNPYFSPNGDGVKDTTTIELSTKAKIPATSWRVVVSNALGKKVRSFSGGGQFPAQIVFNGKNPSGKVLPNGTYTMTFDATFKNGNEEQSTAPVVLSTARPPLAISYSNPYFSPNGDGVKDTTTASLSLKSGEPVATWSLKVENGSGKVVREATASGTPPSQVVFDGTNGSGQTLPDGSYTGVYSVTLADGMSNTVTKSFVIDTTPPKVTLSVSTKIFRPNSSGSDNREVITYTSNKAVTWTGELVNNQNQVLLETRHPMSVKRVVLTKSDPTVEKAPAGLYILDLTFEDRAGNTYSPPPADIALYTHPIKSHVTLVRSGFSPVATSGPTTISASLSTDTPAGIDRYRVDVLRANGNVVRSFAYQGALQPTFTWDGAAGSSNPGSYVSQGNYRLRLTIFYTNGLKSSGNSGTFFVDIAPPEVTSAAKPGPFIVSQSGSSIQGSAQLSLSISDPGKSIRSWSVQLVDPAGNTVKSVKGSGAITRLLSWSGNLPLSGPVPTAITTTAYQLNITATDQYGVQKRKSMNVGLQMIGRVEKGRIHLLVPHLLFGPYKYALNSKSAKQGRTNERTLEEVAKVLKRYPSYNIEVDGYSMEIYKPSNRFYNSEQNIIVPLSKNRADIARNALEQIGISPARIFARYWGGLNTLVNPHNVDLRWMNRRTVFILLPKETPPANEPARLVKRLALAMNARSKSGG